MLKTIPALVLSGLVIIACQSSKIDQEPIILVAQISEPVQEQASSTAVSCPGDMVLVEGDYCPDVEQVCEKLDTRIHNANGFVKCDKYRSPSKCLSKNRPHMKFCMDRFEFPNREGSLPLVMVSWNQMAEACRVQGKRICRDVEWTQACEGPDMLPYPYGYERSADKCNIDHPQKPGFDATQPMTPELVARLDQRVPSGSMPDCVSPYGVHDMTGNVDESVVNSQGKPFKSAEMGGHWIVGARNRCRPRTIVHNEDFQFYEIGGRCCKDTNE